MTTAFEPQCSSTEPKNEKKYSTSKNTEMAKILQKMKNGGKFNPVNRSYR